MKANGFTRWAIISCPIIRSNNTDMVPSVAPTVPKKGRGGAAAGVPPAWRNADCTRAIFERNQEVGSRKLEVGGMKYEMDTS